jgi:hypothetical protein
MHAAGGSYETFKPVDLLELTMITFVYTRIRLFLHRVLPLSSAFTRAVQRLLSTSAHLFHQIPILLRN